MSKATEVKSMKRKGASESTVSAKKIKTTPEKATDKPKELKSALKKGPAAKPAKDAKPAPPAADVKKNARPARKRAEDFLVKEADKSAKTAPATRASVKAKKQSETSAEEPAVKESAAATVSKTKGKKTVEKAEKPAKKQVEEVPSVVESDPEDEDDEDDEVDVDDQTAALLAGFESSEDENDPEDEAGISTDKLPALPDEKNVRKQLKAAEAKNADNKPGVLYVGRIPHGFFEHQMRAYFSQFGDITHLRLSRNKVTGRSKHYAFIEFSSAAVADIVAKTMDKYLLFGHILQVRRIPDDQVHAQLWKGEGRRFKVMPRNKIEGGLLSKSKTRETWEKKTAKETKKREKQAAKLKELGYEFDMPALRSVGDVPTQDLPEDAGLADVGEVKAILEKKADDTNIEIVQTEQEGPQKIKVTAVITEKAGTKRTKAKVDGKKSKKAKVAA